MNRRTLTIAGAIIAAIILVRLVIWPVCEASLDHSERGAVDHPGQEGDVTAPGEPFPLTSTDAPRTGAIVPAPSPPIPDLVSPYTGAVIQVVATAAVAGVVMVLVSLALGAALAAALVSAGSVTGSSRRRRSYIHGRYRDLIQH